MIPASDLLADVDRFLASSGMAATTFGLKAVNDGKLIPRLRAGGDLTSATSRRIYAYIEKYRRTAGSASVII